VCKQQDVILSTACLLLCARLLTSADGVLVQKARHYLGLIHTCWVMIALIYVQYCCAGGTLAHEVGHYLGLIHTDRVFDHLLMPASCCLQYCYPYLQAAHWLMRWAITLD
jgi:hypothetical protein